MIRYVYPDVGRTGLCNMLYPWARAICYAKEHGCRVIAPAWTKFTRIGPILRRERDKRFYVGQFTNQGYVGGFAKMWLLAFGGDKVLRFSGMTDGLKPLIYEAATVKNELIRIANPSYLKALEDLPDEFIGVHIRKGDFLTIGFSLSNEYYVRAIRLARKRVGDIPILVFSDGEASELAYLNSFANVCFMPHAPALQDLLSLTRAEILIATNRSTFSGWAAYLGGMTSFWDKDGERPSESIGLQKFELV